MRTRKGRAMVAWAGIVLAAMAIWTVVALITAVPGESAMQVIIAAAWGAIILWLTGVLVALLVAGLVAVLRWILRPGDR